MWIDKVLHDRTQATQMLEDARMPEMEKYTLRSDILITIEDISTPITLRRNNPKTFRLTPEGMNRLSVKTF